MITGPRAAMFVPWRERAPYSTWNVLIDGQLHLGLDDDTACWNPAVRANRPVTRPRPYRAPWGAEEQGWTPSEEWCPL